MIGMLKRFLAKRRARYEAKVLALPFVVADRERALAQVLWIDVWAKNGDLIGSAPAVLIDGYKVAGGPIKVLRHAEIFEYSVSAVLQGHRVEITPRKQFYFRDSIFAKKGDVLNLTIDVKPYSEARNDIVRTVQASRR